MRSDSNSDRQTSRHQWKHQWNHHHGTISGITIILILMTGIGAISVSGGSWSPLSTQAPPYPRVEHPLPLTRHWSTSCRSPYPTNTWWMNLVLQPTDQPVTIMPMAMRIETTDVSQLSIVPPYNRTAEYEHCTNDRTGTHCREWRASARLNSKAHLPSASMKRGCNFGMSPKKYDAEIVAMFFQPGFVMSAMEDLAPHQVTSWDALSVTIQFAEKSQSESGGGDPTRVEFPLVRGSPYATAVYTNLTPFLFTQNAILAINDQDLPGVVKGNKLRMKINNEQTVIVYAWKNTGSFDDDDDSLQWKWDRNTVELVGPGAARGNWVVRMVILPASKNVRATESEQIYDEYADTYPIGGAFDYSFGKMNDTDVVDLEAETLSTTITWKTASRFDWSAWAAPELLMLSLPHHQATLVSANYAPIRLDSLVGELVGVIGSTWQMRTAAASSSYFDFRTPRKVDPTRVEEIKLQLMKDMKSAATAGEPDPYGFGKSLSKLGRMALIGEELGVDKSEILDLLAKMKDFVAPWLESSNPDQLLYDTRYGGVVSTNGIKDPAQDFGQGYYNDHHFHYGYIAYGCAVLAYFDPAWADVYRENILALVRDYANPSTEDKYFPVLRQFDPYDGHSWAAGLFVFADGRNQESSSESINGYYAMMLLGRALNDPNMAAVGRMLVTLEVLGTRTYWHSQNDATVYPDVFAQNKCIGMKWSDKVVEATWFAAGMTYIHGINMLPFTPASELYLTPSWVREEYPVVIGSVTPDITDEWRGFLYGTHCVIDSDTAWKEIQALTSFDGGNTRSNLMYFCATRGAQPDDHSRTVTLVEDDDSAEIQLS